MITSDPRGAVVFKQRTEEAATMADKSLEVSLPRRTVAESSIPVTAFHPLF